MKKKNSIGIDQSLANRIPYQKTYPESGMILAGGHYSFMYLINDVKPEQLVSYNPATAEKRIRAMFNSFSDNLSFQFITHNRTISRTDFLDRILLKEDVEKDLLPVVKEYNAILTDNSEVGHNNLRKTLYLVVSVKADTAEDALNSLNNAEPALFDAFKDIYEISITKLSLVERLNVMYSMFNPGSEEFGNVIDLDNSGNIDLSNLKYMHLTTKDLVAPKKWNTGNKLLDYSILNENTDTPTYARSFFLNQIPAKVSSSFVSDITSISSGMIFSMTYEPIDKTLGHKKVLDLVNKNTIITKRKKTDTVADRKNKTTLDIEDKKTMSEDTYFNDIALDTMRNAIASEDKLYLCSFTITLFAEDLDTLDKDTELLKLSATKFGSSVVPFDLNQAAGFQTCLPLCNRRTDTLRLLSSDKLAKISPITIEDVVKKDGLYVGINSINDNIIMLNRKNNVNLSGLIAGAEHSGKTYENKREIVNALLSTEDTINIVSDTDEYDEFVLKLGGEIVPFGLPDITYIEKGYGILDGDENVKNLYYDALFIALQRFNEKYQPKEAEERAEDMKGELDLLHTITGQNVIKWIAENGERVPRLYQSLNELKKYQPQSLMASKRLVLYKAKDRVEKVILLDYLWNKTLYDKKNNKTNWIFVDSIDSVITYSQGSLYVNSYEKYASMFQTVFTSVVQQSVKLFGNPADVVALEGLVRGCGYVKLLNLGPIERSHFQSILNIPYALMPYISNVEPGKGLIMTSASNVAFSDSYKELYPDSDFKDLFAKHIEQIKIDDNDN